MPQQTLFKVDKNLVKITIHFEDKTMVGKFYTFLLEHKIAPAVKGSKTGDYKFSAFFTSADSIKIVDFLKQNNAKNCQILQS